MDTNTMKDALRTAGRTKAERAEWVIRECGKQGQHWVYGGPRSWSKDEIDNAVLALAEGRLP